MMSVKSSSSSAAPAAEAVPDRVLMTPMLPAGTAEIITDFKTLRYLSSRVLGAGSGLTEYFCPTVAGTLWRRSSLMSREMVA